MDYSTQGKISFTDFHLPLKYMKGLPDSEFPEQYMALMIITEGALIHKSPTQDRMYLPATVLWISDGGTIRQKFNITERSCVHSLVFHPKALSDSTDVLQSSRELNTAFYLKPFADNTDDTPTAVNLSSHTLHRLEDLLKTLDDNLNHQIRPDFWPCLSRSFFLEILILLQRTFYVEHKEQGLEYPPPPEDLKPIVEFIHNHYNTSLQLEDLATRFGTNRTTLNEKFKGYINSSTMDYINRIRCDVASGLLRKTLLPVSEIAERVGIEDPSYFGRFFKKRTGITPSEYRESFPYPYS